MEIFGTYYSPNDVYQTLFFGGAGALGLLIVWYVFVRAPQKRLTEMAPWAAKRGLKFTPPSRGMGAHTIAEEVSVLEGALQGVPFVLRSIYLANARAAGINGRTEIQCRSATPAGVAFQVELRPGPSVQGPDAVWTGDAMFDARVRTRSDDAGAAGPGSSPR